MSHHIIPAWKKNPFVRMLIPLIVGIIFSWFIPIDPKFAWSAFTFFVFLLFLFKHYSIFIQFKYNWVRGIVLHLIIFDIGILLLFYNNNSIAKKRNDPIYKTSYWIAVLEEPVSEKPKSFRVEATVQSLIRNDGIKDKVNVLLYIQKGSEIDSLKYGTKIIFCKPIQPIKNFGNPPVFDYQRYCIFQHISGQVYLKRTEFIILPQKQENIFKKYLFDTRQKILTILRTYLIDKKIIGLAEALLIGYKDDLDKDLIQSYSQTGVAHIIAISGLHLALIYSLIQFFFERIKLGKKISWTKPFIVLSFLWMFSFLSGASPSVLRSSVMFSFIVIGKQFAKSSSIYNSLAASAFLLLCYNPFWLWDVGFQLSYGAVLSIVVFMKPIYNWLFIQNKILDLIWKSASVTIAAQILTFPVTIYYFHQFPNYFLFTNLLAVPLSSLVLVGELFICILSFIPVVAKITGSFVAWLIFILNSFIEHMQGLPFSMLENLNINLIQVIFIYIVIIVVSLWLKEKNKLQQV
ncbi:MAG: ComEC/Rec2 family competence protein [Bacteroidetes bacterium]|nr:ComEC/Rec2 family competence protein [Bacteroidota bacterium]